ncbi:MAG: hypothetical protein QGI10_07565 [Vicinamibacterales bacterium]|nr:hypothetical protein [Vicinamibacterales bacterium]HJN43038.1 hypothetical protein [Vicinamibacterales bacterium]
MGSRLPVMVGVLAVALALLAPGAVAQQSDAGIPRTADGRPDLSGTYDIATLTPLQRPAEFGDKLVLTEEEAAALAARAGSLERIFNIPDERNQESGPPREAPPIGGDGSSGAAGNVGGYNSFWIDRGSAAFQIDGQWRTSIITEPSNGRQPSLTADAQAQRASLAGFFRPNTGTAWWLEDDLNAPGPYDHPEGRPLSERCLMGFGSTAGPPMLPVLYNNLKRIVQTEDTVVILVEMVHDARIIRMNQEHAPPEVRTWLGDSVGRWEGDTLVVDTTNFRDTPSLGQASRNLHVVERFTRVDADTLLYQFMVEDPTVWTAPWGGEYVWPASENKVYEYACHEANYSFGGILRGARVLEADAREAR